MNEILNIDGEFQVAGTVFKVTEDKFISIVDPEETDPSTVDNETETDSTKGVYVRELYAGGCCPQLHDQLNVYQNNPRKRVRGLYYVADVSEFFEDYIHPGRVVFFPNILVHSEAAHQRRKCFVFICLWRCENVQLSNDFDITVYHDAGSWGITNPIEFSDDWGPSSSCRHVAENPNLANAWSIYPAFIPEFSFCVDEVSEVATNSTPTTPVTATYSCR